MLYSGVDDDITSCVQETYIKAWNKIEFLKKHKNVAGWLVATAKNVAMDFNKNYLLRQKFIAASDGIENIYDEKDFVEKIAGELMAEKILSKLSLNERKLYELKYDVGLNNEDIGKILGISPNAVASRTKRLIEKLKEFYVSQK